MRRRESEGDRKRPQARLGSRQAERVGWSWPGRRDCEAPARRAEGQAGNTEGCSSARRCPCQVREAALMGEWQVPAGRVPKATESGATACVSGHVGAGAVPGRPGAASLPGAPLSWRYPAARPPEDPRGRQSLPQPAPQGALASGSALRLKDCSPSTPHPLVPELPGRAPAPHPESTSPQLWPSAHC